MADFFTADNHFWHKNIIDYCERPFKNVVDMNNSMIKLWNEGVSKNDTVYIMGDFCLSGVAKTIDIISQLNGKKILIMGNHDYINHKKMEKWLTMGVNEVYNSGTYEKGGLVTKLSHFPYKTYEVDKRTFRDLPSSCMLEDQGYYLLHGHVHRAWKRKGRMINVGVDQWDYKPVSFDQIKNEVNAYLNESWHSI